MLNGKYISVKNIISKVYRDLKPKDDTDFTDIIEWCAEALDFIHVYPQFKEVPTCLEVNNFKAVLPNDYISMVILEHNGTPITYASNIYGPQDNTYSDRYLTPYSYNQKKIENAVFVDPKLMHRFANGDTVKIENGYVKTSFKEGKMLCIYMAMVTDCDGYPMVPDEQSFREALTWYCIYKYLYSKAINGEVAAQFYTDAYSKWLKYCNQAGAEAMMPDLMMLENIKRNFIKLKPDVEQFKNFFNNLSNG